MKTEGRIAIVTGASSGIGESVAIKLAELGVKTLVLVDMSKGMYDLATKIGQAYPNVQVLTFDGDVANEKFRSDVFEYLVKQIGTPTIIVTCAGITKDGLAVKLNKTDGELELYPIENFRKILEVNLLAPTYWTMEMVAHVAQSRLASKKTKWNAEEGIQAVSVFIGSVASMGNKGQVAYSSAKRGLGAVVDTLNKESMYYGVKNCIVHPGFVNTPMVQKLNPEVVQNNVLPNTQLKRLIQPREIADSVAFMILNDAFFGGMTVGAGWHPQS